MSNQKYYFIIEAPPRDAFKFEEVISIASGRLNGGKYPTVKYFRDEFDASHLFIIVEAKNLKQAESIKLSVSSILTFLIQVQRNKDNYHYSDFKIHDLGSENQGIVFKGNLVDVMYIPILLRV